VSLSVVKLLVGHDDDVRLEIHDPTVRASVAETIRAIAVKTSVERRWIERGTSGENHDQVEDTDDCRRGELSGRL